MARTICLRHDIPFAKSKRYDISLRDVICSALRNVKERIRRGGFFSSLLYFALDMLGVGKSRAALTPHPTLPQAGGHYSKRFLFYVRIDCLNSYVIELKPAFCGNINNFYTIGFEHNSFIGS